MIKLLKNLIFFIMMCCVALLMIVNIPNIKNYWKEDIAPKIVQTVEDKTEGQENTQTPAEIPADVVE